MSTTHPPYAVGQRVQHGYAGAVGTVTDATGGRVAVRIDGGGTDSAPAHFRTWRILPAVDSLYRDERPAAQPDDAYWTDTVVKQGHADYCLAWGHVTGAPRCGRCGETTPVGEEAPAQPGHAYSFYVGSSVVFDAHSESGAILPTPLQGVVVDRVWGVWDDSLEAVNVYQTRLSDDETALRVAYGAAIATGNDAVLVTRDAFKGEADRAMTATARYRVSTVRAEEGNRTLVGNPHDTVNVGDEITTRYGRATVTRKGSVAGWATLFDGQEIRWETAQLSPADMTGYQFVPDIRGDEIAWLVSADASVSTVSA